MSNARNVVGVSFPVQRMRKGLIGFRCDYRPLTRWPCLGLPAHCIANIHESLIPKPLSTVFPAVNRCCDCIKN